jgi:hypothetical protein
MVGKILYQQPCRYFCAHDIVFIYKLSHRRNSVWGGWVKSCSIL